MRSRISSSVSSTGPLSSTVTALGQPAFASSSPGRGADLSGRAIPALKTVVVDERLLQRVQLIAVGQAGRGDYLRPVVGHR